MRRIAFDASAVGNVTENVPLVDVFVLPKSRPATHAFAALLFQMPAPSALIVADVHDMSEKSQNAVVPEVVGVTLVNVEPPVA